MIRKFLLLQIGLLLYCVCGSVTVDAAVNQSLEGQLVGLAADVKDFLDQDRLLKGKKLRLEEVSSKAMPDANCEPFIEEKLSALLEGTIGQSTNLSLSVEISYLVSQTKTNKNNRVIQITATLIDKGIPRKSFLREVNNTSDIGRVLGSTLAPPDTQDYQERLASVTKAFEEPSFKLRNQSQIQAIGNTNYSIEIRKRIGGKGNADPVVPVDENGLAFAPIEVEDTYEIVLFNYDVNADAVAKVDIDGLDAINTFNSDVDADGNKVVYPGYFVPRATASGPGRHVIPGWLHTVKPGADNVFEFVVNKLGQGAASEKEVRGKTGVITVRFFDAYDPNERPRGRNFGETGKGQPRKQDYRLVEAVIGTEPLSIVSVRYSQSPE